MNSIGSNPKFDTTKSKLKFNFFLIFFNINQVKNYFFNPGGEILSFKFKHFF